MAAVVLAGTARAQVIPTLLNQWGSFGSGPGQFQYPYGAAVGSDGSVYVTDQYGYRIEEFGPMGDFIRAWGSQGNGPGQFGKTIGICVAPSGQVYVADYDNRRVQVFTSDGGFVRSLAGGVYARDVSVAANGDTYVLNTNPSALTTPVEVFDSIGGFKLEIGKTFIKGGGLTPVFETTDYGRIPRSTEDPACARVGSAKSRSSRSCASRSARA